MLKKIAIMVLISVFVFNIGAPVFASEAHDDWNGSDKTGHFIASAAVYTVAYNYLINNTDMEEKDAKKTAFLFTLAAGCIKEISDSEYSWRDMGANALGAGFGYVVSIKF